MQSRPWLRHYDFQVPETFKYPQIPASEFLLQASKLFPGKTALDFYGTRTTFWELRKKVLAMARVMGEMGVEKGDRVADEYRGETVKAFIVLKPGEEATDKDIIDFARTKLAPYKAPKIVEFREDLPKSAVGKILRKELRKEEERKRN